MQKIAYTKKAAKYLSKIPEKERFRIVRSINQLPDYFEQSKNLDVKKLQARNGYRIRIGDWRVIFDVVGKPEQFQILVVRNRGDIYK